jgi:hypothetical protein
MDIGNDTTSIFGKILAAKDEAAKKAVMMELIEALRKLMKSIEERMT